MQRVARYGRLKAEAVAEYRALHEGMSKELISAHQSAGFRNFSIYLRGTDLFSYLECDNWDIALKRFSANPVTRAWSERISTLLDEPLEWEFLEEVWRLE